MLREAGPSRFLAALVMAPIVPAAADPVPPPESAGWLDGRAHVVGRSRFARHFPARPRAHAAAAPGRFGTQALLTDEEYAKAVSDAAEVEAGADREDAANQLGGATGSNGAAPCARPLSSPSPRTAASRK